MGAAWGHWSHSHLYPVPSYSGLPMALHCLLQEVPSWTPCSLWWGPAGSHSDHTPGAAWFSAAATAHPPHTGCGPAWSPGIPPDLKPSSHTDQAPGGPASRWTPPPRPKARAQSEDTLLTPAGAQTLLHLSHSEQWRLVAPCGWIMALVPLKQEGRLFFLPYSAFAPRDPLTVPQLIP